MLEENPNSAWTAYNLALALEAMNDTKGAEDALRKAIDIDPKLAQDSGRIGPAGVGREATCNPRRSGWNPHSILTLNSWRRAEIWRWFMPGRAIWFRPRKLLRQAIEDDPKYKEGHLNLGLILAQQNRKSDAEQELDKAVALAPKDPATLSTVGKAKMQMGKVSEGIALLRKVVDLAPDLAAAHLDLALALADSYDLPAALAQTGEAVRLAPQSGVAHFYRGRILYDLGRSTEAQPEFETACRLDPQMPEPRYFLALIDKQEGKYQLAAGLLEETVKLQPDNVMAWYMLGESLEQESENCEGTSGLAEGDRDRSEV